MRMRREIRRRRFLAGGAAATGSLLLLPGRAPAQGGAKPLTGTTLNVSCWSHPYAKLLTGLIPQFEQETGAKVNYETPSFPIYNQRIDIELSTGGSAYDVLNVTFIYIGRWLEAGWFVPLDDYLRDPKKTPADWNPGDFLPGLSVAFRNKAGQLFAIPWTGDIYLAGAARYDIFARAGKAMPEDFDGLRTTMQAINGKDGVPAFLAENHYGWSFIPFLQGFGGNVFRNPPDDLMPVLDTPEAIAAADYFSGLVRDYGPDGAISYTYEMVVSALKAGHANYSPNGQIFLVQMGAADSKVAHTCNFSICPAGPKGRFPGVATHGWGIPVGAKNKDAAWAFIVWAMSKPVLKKMVEQGYSSITRRSLIDSPEFKGKMTINGHDIAKIYVDTVAYGTKGYMKYRTVPVYPQVDKQIDIAIQNVASRQMNATAAMRQAQQNSLQELKRAGVNL
jgi:multiple sugar transport system substrate-binding protein